MDVIIGPPPRQPITARAANAVTDVLNDEVARAVLSAPQDYSLAVRHAACCWLMEHGDWLDHQRVQHVFPVVLYDLTSEDPVVEPGAPPSKMLIWLLVAALLTIWLIVVLGKAYGQYRYDVALSAEWVMR